MINRKEVNKYMYDNFIYEKDKYKMSVVIATLLKNISMMTDCALILNLTYDYTNIGFMLSDGKTEERFKYNINNIIRYKKLKNVRNNI